MHNCLLLFALVLSFVSVSDTSCGLVVEDDATYVRETDTYAYAAAENTHKTCSDMTQLQRSTMLGILFASRRCLPR